MIHIDTREPLALRYLVARVVGGCSTECVKLKVCQHKVIRAVQPSGDYVFTDKCNHTLGIERKDVSDLLGSLSKFMKNGNKRLWDQLARMESEYTHRLLIVEGYMGMDLTSKMVTTSKLFDPLGARHTGWRYAAVEMILWSVQQTYHTPILYTADQQATVETLRVLHNRALAGCVLPSSMRELAEQANEVESSK